MAAVDLPRAAACLCALALPYTQGRGQQERRKTLLMAIEDVRRAMNDGPSNKQHTDPEQLVREYINQGGDWQRLVAAVRRNSLDGATACMRKEN